MIVFFHRFPRELEDLEPWNEEKGKRQGGSAKVVDNRPVTVKHRRFN